VTVSDTLHAGDLTSEHVGRRMRVDGHEGVLRDLVHLDDTHTQLLLAVPGATPSVPVVGQGAAVELLD
jgi:hypothetical protein